MTGSVANMAVEGESGPDPAVSPPPIDSLQGVAGRLVGPHGQYGTDGMAGLVNILQSLLARIGKRLGHDADQIIVYHGRHGIGFRHSVLGAG